MSRSISLAACLLAVVLAGLNLRPALASIGPLLDALQASAKLSDSLASLLTSLPVLLMGLGALGAAQLLRYFGVRLGVAFGLLLIALACALRLLPGQAGLLGGAVLAGLGIAACQALLPVFIRQRFGARVGGAMGAYSTAIMGGAVLASVASPWLARAWGELPALAFWALPACWRCRSGPERHGERRPSALRRRRSPVSPGARHGWRCSSAWARAPTCWYSPGSRRTTPPWAGRRLRRVPCSAV